MFIRCSLLLLITASLQSAQARQAPYNPTIFHDSIVVKAHPRYDHKSGIHRFLFGENYRKEWGAPVRLPLISISQVYGGLTPLRQGGGMQSKSLRLQDKNGKEWVIRSVEKTPDKLLPENVKGTFVLDWVDDAMSGQHPYSALIVPPLAEAAGVYHAHPVIGVLAPDSALGEYSKIFTGLIVLLEEREPAGKSDNSIKMVEELVSDNNNRFDKEQFLRARLLDLLMGDWDRHEDQWRWYIQKQDKGKLYQAVPRDRDQVFHITQGLFPSIAALPWLDPTLENFNGRIPRIRYSLYKTRFMKPLPDAQISTEEWMRITNTFVAAETDSVLEQGLQRLPKEIYGMRHDELLSKLKTRRNNIPTAMTQYYHFIYHIADLRLSNKNEIVTLTDAPAKALRVVVTKSNTGQPADTILNMVYQPHITKEIRLYLSNGNDQVIVNNANSPIHLKIIGGSGTKTFNIQQAHHKISTWNQRDSVQFSGQTNRLHNHLSRDTGITTFVGTNPYNVWQPLSTAAINADDGFLLALGFKYTKMDGFRKLPYSGTQELLITHSFATSAFRVHYNGEWIHAIGKADFTLKANIQAPDNTMNFFGRGNETILLKEGDYHTYHRTRFDTYQFDPALRWHTGKGNTLSTGPSLLFYHLNPEENKDRFINQTTQINSYDSTTIANDKTHLGLLVNYNSNHRNSDVLPSKGYYLNVTAQGYAGLNSNSKSFALLKPEFTWYQSLNHSSTIVLSDRIGGGVSLGKTTFYQSMFLGGQGNLLGYLQNRFAGQHMAFNNLQARIKLFDIASYIIPGQLGLLGFYDAGRVWSKGEHSNKWHTGTGGGLYFSPASLTVIQLLAGHSTEGWYPYISLNFRL